MRILADARSMGKRPSGVGMYLFGFLEPLAKKVEHELYVLTDVNESPELCKLEENGVEIITLGYVISKSAAVFSWFHFVQKQVFRLKPDIFWEPNNLFPVRIRNPFGKIVVTVQDMFPLTTKDCYTRTYPYYFRYGVGKALKYADEVLYISEETKKETECFFPQAAKVSWHISGVVVDGMPTLPIHDGGFFFYVGNLERRKGTDILIQSYQRYLAAGGDRRMILGGNIREDRIRRLVEEAEATGMVEYRGYMDTEEKYRLYSSCSAFLFPSRAEGFGIPVIEALYYRKPVLALELSIYRETAPGCIQTVPASGDDEKIIDAYAKAIQTMSIEPLDEERARQVTDRWRAEVLTERVTGVFERIICGSELMPDR